jgi:hypothetical protein
MNTEYIRDYEEMSCRRWSEILRSRRQKLKSVDNMVVLYTIQTRRSLNSLG